MVELTTIEIVIGLVLMAIVAGYAGFVVGQQYPE
jgi:uncharacterized membrane protein